MEKRPFEHVSPFLRTDVCCHENRVGLTLPREGAAVHSQIIGIEPGCTTTQHPAFVNRFLSSLSLQNRQDSPTCSAGFARATTRWGRPGVFTIHEFPRAQPQWTAKRSCDGHPALADATGVRLTWARTDGVKVPYA
jgi:hypothetical protein